MRYSLLIYLKSRHCIRANDCPTQLVLNAAISVEHFLVLTVVF